MKLLLAQKILALITVLGLLYFGVVPIHEWCHVVAIRIAGGDAAVLYSFWGYIPFGGETFPINSISQVFDYNFLHWWVYFAGGFGVFLGCMLLWFWSKKSRAVYISLPAIMIGLGQLVYAFLEPLFCFIVPNLYPYLWYFYLAGVSIGVIWGLVIESERVRAWFRAKEF